MLYFAYGSNLDPEQMRERCPGHRVVGLAACTTTGSTSRSTRSDWGGGVASVAAPSRRARCGASSTSSTRGRFARLDEYRRFRESGDQHNVYDREHVNVELVRPDDGSVPRRVRADIYFARPSNPSPPSRRYLDTSLPARGTIGCPRSTSARLAAHKVGAESDAA